jgi:hypothetical protein
MPIYEFTSNELIPVNRTSYASENIMERSHLQSALKKNIEIVAPDCRVISEEFSEWSDSQRRIDLLAVDKNANLVVIELKRTEKGEYMELQAIRYSAMVSTLTFRRTVDIHQHYLDKNEASGNAEQKLLEFLDWDYTHEEGFNNEVRIILISANFSKELTTSVLWLNQHLVDITCVRLIPYKNNDQLLIDVQQIIPLPEAESFQVKIKQKAEEQRQQRASERDFTRYSFDGNDYNKRKLVLAVITYWISQNKPADIDALQKAFPPSLHGSGLFAQYETAKEVYSRSGISRHFLGDDELIRFADDSVYAISNQWGKGNIEGFIQTSIELGLEITER